MCHYRIYSVRADGSFSGAEDVECADDDAALAYAVEQVGPARAEVWQAARLVAIVNPPTEHPRRPTSTLQPVERTDQRG